MISGYLCRVRLLKSTSASILKLLLFWVIIFDIERILFSIHNWGKFSDIGFGEWLLAFVYSLRLDLATAALLSLVPIVLLVLFFVYPNKWLKRSFYWVVFIEFLICAMIHGGEINAYPEWNTKLTTRVFTHLLNPDEVVRTADYSMTIWFVIYASIEVFLSYKLMRMMFKFKETTQPFSWLIRLPIALVTLAVSGIIFVIIGRGGTQPIPINIDSAYYTKGYVCF